MCLRKYCHISPLLRATGIIPVSDSIVYQCLDLCKNCVLNDSIASDFYCELLLSANIQTAKNRTLIGRAMNYVAGHNFTGFSRAWKQLTIALGFTSGNNQLFPGPPESLEPDSFPCCPRDQSLFV